MREIINSISVGGLTAVYRRESETGVVELVLIPAGCESEIVRTDRRAAGAGKAVNGRCTRLFQRRAHHAQRSHRQRYCVRWADCTKI